MRRNTEDVSNIVDDAIVTYMDAPSIMFSGYPYVREEHFMAEVEYDGPCIEVEKYIGDMEEIHVVYQKSHDMEYEKMEYTDMIDGITVEITRIGHALCIGFTEHTDSPYTEIMRLNLDYFLDISRLYEPIRIKDRYENVTLNRIK